MRSSNRALNLQNPKNQEETHIVDLQRPQ